MATVWGAVTWVFKHVIFFFTWGLLEIRGRKKVF